jgi:hypothetical protein
MTDNRLGVYCSLCPENRALTGGVATFGNKTNLSNTTDIDSVDTEIGAEGGCNRYLVGEESNCKYACER